MKQDYPLISRLKNAITSNKNVLGLAASSCLTVLCLVLFMTANHWAARVFLAVVAIGAALFTRLLYEGLRITQNYEKEKRLHGAPLPQTAEESTEPEGDLNAQEEEKEEEDSADTEIPPGLEPEGPIYFISEKGSKYHRDRSCAGLKFADVIQEVSEEEAAALGRQACTRCAQKQA